MGINGLGCIGRLALRAAITNLEVEVQAAGDPFMDLKFVVYQVKCGSMHEEFLAPSLPTTMCSIAMPTAMGINGCGRIGRLVDALPSPTHRLRSRQQRSFHGHVAHGLPDKCSSVRDWFPGAIAMPTTICINRHADHHGINVLGCIGRFAFARPSPTWRLRSRQWAIPSWT